MEILAASREEEERLAAKEEEVRVHFAAVTEVLYGRLNAERKAEIDKIDDQVARSSAIASYRAELLTPSEAEASNLEEFLAQVRAHDDRAQVALGLLGDCRAAAEAEPRL